MMDKKLPALIGIIYFLTCLLVEHVSIKKEEEKYALAELEAKKEVVLIPVSHNIPYSLNKPNRKFKYVLKNIKEHKIQIINEISSMQQANKEQLLCLALNIYHEARGSVMLDQQGIVYVTINRIKNQDNLSDVCSVVWQQKKSLGVLVGQFSWTTKSKEQIIPKEEEAWLKAQHLALNTYRHKFSKIYASYDITHGATSYYAPKRIHTPYWAKSKNVCARTKIGAHIYIKVNNS